MGVCAGKYEKTGIESQRYAAKATQNISEWMAGFREKKYRLILSMYPMNAYDFQATDAGIIR